MGLEELPCRSSPHAFAAFPPAAEQTPLVEQISVLYLRRRALALVYQYVANVKQRCQATLATLPKLDDAMLTRDQESCVLCIDEVRISSVPHAGDGVVWKISAPQSPLLATPPCSCSSLPTGKGRRGSATRELWMSCRRQITVDALFHTRHIARSNLRFRLDGGWEVGEALRGCILPICKHWRAGFRRPGHRDWEAVRCLMAGRV
jgi:hypothetical protein